MSFTAMLEVLEKRHCKAPCARLCQKRRRRVLRNEGDIERQQKVLRPEGFTGKIKRSYLSKTVTTKDKDAAVFSKTWLAMWEFQKLGDRTSDSEHILLLQRNRVGSQNSIPSSSPTPIISVPVDPKPLPSAGPYTHMCPTSIYIIKNNKYKSLKIF